MEEMDSLVILRRPEITFKSVKIRHIFGSDTSFMQHVMTNKK